MQHYKVCCSKQFPTLFSLPQACPCCMLCTICVKNAARDELLWAEEITRRLTRQTHDLEKSPVAI